MNDTNSQSSLLKPTEHVTWRIIGQVQGVGFRPFIYRIANKLNLTGTVRNDPQGVTVETWGTATLHDTFEHHIIAQAPALASVDSVAVLNRTKIIDKTPLTTTPTDFTIIQSDHNPAARGRVTIDSATCSDCIDELFDAEDLRFHHALINCTNCGPRYTIVCDLPYDRPLTTMAAFPMCLKCESEYKDPADRRFHAQPTCCPDCGPQICFVNSDNETVGREKDSDPILEAAHLLRTGGIIAIKGLGGYHLATLATDDAAVRRLRRLKKRDHKPFALMVRDLDTAQQLVMLSDVANVELQSPAAPIILACRHKNNDRFATSAIDDELASDSSQIPLSSLVAPSNHRLGIMLPNTPLQHLIANEPDMAVLIMTSANISDDPLVIDDTEARQRLAHLCDAFLIHDRPIERAVDDSVILDTETHLLPLRRARGYVPQPLNIPVKTDLPGLCVGGELKNVVALARNGEVVLSQHLGDLTYALAYRRFERTIEDLKRLFDIDPRWVACDPHPGYLSRRFARKYAQLHNIPLIEIQHHHAHMASLMAEHNQTDPMIGIVCDGVGYGDDGHAWGGEILYGDLAHYERVGHLRPMRLPGGDAAAKQTGRCAASCLYDLLGSGAEAHDITKRILPNKKERHSIFHMLKTDLSCPSSSGLGRLFDAAAAILGVCDFNHYEAMAGIQLEALASKSIEQPEGTYAVTVPRDPPYILDPRLMLQDLINRTESGISLAECAWFFHDAIASGFALAASKAAQHYGCHTIGLTGGVFCNAILSKLVNDKLTAQGFEVLQHHKVPANDGGIAFGQAAAAIAQSIAHDQ